MVASHCKHIENFKCADKYMYFVIVIVIIIIIIIVIVIIIVIIGVMQAILFFAWAN